MRRKRWISSMYSIVLKNFTLLSNRILLYICERLGICYNRLYSSSTNAYIRQPENKFNDERALSFKESFILPITLNTGAPLLVCENTKWVYFGNNFLTEWIPHILLSTKWQENETETRTIYSWKKNSMS